MLCDISHLIPHRTVCRASPKETLRFSDSKNTKHTMLNIHPYSKFIVIKVIMIIMIIIASSCKNLFVQLFQKLHVLASVASVVFFVVQTQQPILSTKQSQSLRYTVIVFFMLWWFTSSCDPHSWSWYHHDFFQTA